MRKEGLLDQRACSNVPVHRRRPWNGELCRLVQPAGSWSRQRAAKRVVASERARSAKIGARNKTTNAGSHRLFLLPPLSLRAITSVLSSRCVGRLRATKIQPDTHVSG